MLNANKAMSEITSARDDELEALLARGPALDAGLRKMVEQEKTRRASRMTPMSAAQPTPRFAAGGLMAPPTQMPAPGTSQVAKPSPPPGALPNEVADNVDAKLSEGEFVLPADVVRYIGLEKLMQMRDKAKKGLGSMSQQGQIQQAPQQVKMAQGGLVGSPASSKEEERKLNPMPSADTQFNLLGPVMVGAPPRTKEEERKLNQTPTADTIMDFTNPAAGQAAAFSPTTAVGQPVAASAPAQNMSLMAPNQDDYTRAATAAGMPLETYTDRFGRIGYRTPGAASGPVITAPTQYTPTRPPSPATPSTGGLGGSRSSTGIRPPSLTDTIVGGVTSGLGVAAIGAGANTVADVVGGTPVGEAINNNFVRPVESLLGTNTLPTTASGVNAINSIGSGQSIINSFAGVPTQTAGQIASAAGPALNPASVATGGYMYHPGAGGASGSIFNPANITDASFQVGSIPPATQPGQGGVSFGEAGTGTASAGLGAPSWAQGSDMFGRPGFFQNTTTNTIANAGLGIAGGLAGNFVGDRVGNAIGSDRLGGSYGGAAGALAGSIASKSLAAIPGMQFMAIPGVGEFFGATLGRIIGGFIGANPTQGLRSSTEVAVVNGQLTNTGKGVDPGIRTGKATREVVPKIEGALDQLNESVLKSIDHIVRDVGGTLTDGKMVSIGIRNGNKGPLKTKGETRFVTSTDINYTWDGHKKAQDKGDMFETADQAIAGALVRAIDSGMITGGDANKLRQYRTDLYNFAFGQQQAPQISQATQPATGLGAPTRPQNTTPTADTEFDLVGPMPTGLGASRT